MTTTFLQKPRKPLRRTPFKRKATVKKRKKKSDLQKLKEKLWELCKQITRATYGNTCYTCGKAGLEGSNWHTGHFISSSICSTALRYDLRNLRPQCYNCNINKSGNWLAFEYHLRKDGIDVQELKTQNELGKGLMYREDWYEAKIAEYELLTREDI
jgi:hypothetical protein